MKLENTTDFPDYFLRRMISWICGQLELPVRHTLWATFKNKSIYATSLTSGYAYPRRIAIGIGTTKAFLCSNDPIMDRRKGRLSNLLWVTAHELAHVDNCRLKDRTRRGGSWGGSERYTDKRANEVKEVFLKQWQTLEAQWLNPPAIRACAAPKKPIVEQRADRAAELLRQWQKKLKLAETKVAKYAAKVRYYEKQKAQKE